MSTSHPSAQPCTLHWGFSGPPVLQQDGNPRRRGSHSKRGPAGGQLCAHHLLAREPDHLTAQGASWKGAPGPRPRTMPQRAPPAFTPSCPQALSSPRAWTRPASEDAVLPPPNRQRGSSQPAGGTSLRSQAPGQRKCQSKGNSRHGQGLSQLGLVRQGPSSKGQSRMRVASPGCRASRRQPRACRDHLLYPGHCRPPGQREAHAGPALWEPAVPSWQPRPHGHPSPSWKEQRGAQSVTARDHPCTCSQQEVCLLCRGQALDRKKHGVEERTQDWGRWPERAEIALCLSPGRAILSSNSICSNRQGQSLGQRLCWGFNELTKSPAPGGTAGRCPIVAH